MSPIQPFQAARLKAKSLLCLAVRKGDVQENKKLNRKQAAIDITVCLPP
jgi:hypothetical protein